MILVTGAAGLIGSAVVRELNARGRTDLILVDHLGSGEKWLNLRSLVYQEYYEKGPFLNLLEKGYQYPLSEIRSIIHLGACSSTTEMDASYLIENNYRYSRLLADMAIARNLRMVYASSAATYGDGRQGFLDNDNIDNLRPLNAYGYSKHAFDQYLSGRRFRPGFAGVKYFNVYGPNEYHKGNMQSLVIKAFHQINQRGELGLFKSYHPDYKHGEQKRDFLYVKDAAKMTVFLLLDKPDVCGLYNAGSGQASTWIELADAIFEAMGKKKKIRFINMPESMRDKYQYYTCAPIDKIRAAGFDDTITPLADAVGDYVRNYLMQGELRA